MENNQIDIDELIEKIEKSIPEWELLLLAQKKNPRDPMEAMYWKKMEDGIIENLWRMNEYQLEHFNKSHYRGIFRWYSELNDDKIFREYVKQSKRKKALDNLL
jgi:hypothetical protein